MLSSFTKNRDAVITKTLWLNRRIIHVHKGKSYTKVNMVHQMIGHKLGEFSLTKKLGAKIHIQKKKKKQKNKKK